METQPTGEPRLIRERGDALPDDAPDARYAAAPSRGLCRRVRQRLCAQTPCDTVTPESGVRNSLKGMRIMRYSLGEFLRRVSGVTVSQPLNGDAQ